MLKNKYLFVFYKITSKTLKTTFVTLFLEEHTFIFLKQYLPFRLEAFLEQFFLKTLKWYEYNINLIIYWIIFTILMSLCVRNEYGYDIENVHYIIFSLAMGYGVYLHKHFYPKETKYLFIKLFIVCIIVIKIFWPLLTYLWPFTTWFLTFQDLVRLILFIWPHLKIVKKPFNFFYYYI